VAAVVMGFSLCAGCGYIGGPMPPLINVPNKVSSLAAVQRGDKLVVQFGVPVRTTENEPLKPPVRLELRIGDKHPEAPQVKDGIARYEIPVSDLAGKSVLVEVRVVGSNGKDSGWSTLSVPVVKAVEMPHDIMAESAAAGVRLTWKGEGQHFRVFRSADEKDAAYTQMAGDVTAHEYADASAEFGKTYRYLVQSFEPAGGGHIAESELPGAVTVTPVAPLPGVPAGLRAIAGTASIELSWDAPEGTPAVAYRIYRSTGDGEFVKIGEAEAAPAYSDKAVEAGKTYRYAVSAVDAAGREGKRSAAVEAAL
jgi:hypothetical protein